MIAKTYIINNLNELDRLYNHAGTKKQLFYSKLAILELCGWIEQSMDDLVRKTAKRKLLKREDIDYVEKKIIERNYGFIYPLFKRMLCQVVGLYKVARIEMKISQPKFIDLTSTLLNLKKSRDDEAHTHIKGTKRINAPSVTINDFYKVYVGLKEFERLVRNI